MRKTEGARGWKALSPGKRAAWIALAALGAVLLTLLGAVLYYGAILRGALDRATDLGPDRALVAVYVARDDPARTIGDTRGYAYGAVEGEPYGEQALARLEEMLGEEVAPARYGTAFALADALRQGECRAILLGDSYAQALAEARGYAWTGDGLRRLGGLEIQVEGDGAELAVPDDLPESFVVYLSGIDAFGSLATRSRSDVNILAAVNTRRKEMLLVATPRDFYVSFAQTGGAKDKLAHAGIYGVSASVDALEGLYGVEVDYYVRLNFTGFVEIIDALGGVEVYSEQDFAVEPIKEYHRGYNHLTGLEALAFARERYSFADGDYQRARNQMEVIRAVVEKCSSPALLGSFRPVMEAVGEHLETNMPQGHIYGLASLQLADPSPWTVTSYTAQGESAYRETFSMPGQELYVILPGEESVARAREELEAVLG